ncbi:Sulfur carrier protein CysO [Methylacidimicrobium cyclopophantes]|uniref:Sulfur carrier protein CysO n=1 Tax=Methylacidimicrobium cyclopophantes TaxID=1041766 RepID=A0A5E6MH34_9BACT|nr:MoaD/ThiS family protein [Methylacidimicrobium cyclopophantes]VVM07673.1 Sulfur carrier protein CysO [Methylacidimicrobium cyclopophantes]
MSEITAERTIPVRIPTPLRGLTGNQDLVSARGSTIGEILKDLQSQFPGIAERLFDQTGNLRRFVAVYVNGEDIRFLQDQKTPVGPEDEVSIVPAVAGG